MFSFAILEVAIGLVFVYLLLSLICSAVNEWVAGKLRLRADTLQKGIAKLLQGELAAEVLKHPLINGVTENATRGPSYIPPRLFATALMDVIAPQTPGGPKSLAELQDALSRLPDGDAKRALLALVNDVKGDIDEARSSIERWFNDAMERVSGWYKRRAQRLIIYWAIGVTLVLNADTISIARALWKEPALRASVVAAAEKRVASSSPSSGSNIAGTSETSSDPDATPVQGSSPEIRQSLTDLQNLKLPIGWAARWTELELKSLQPLPRDLWGRGLVFALALPGWIIESFAGWAVTIIALSFGAPFWFDALKQLVNIRSAGKPPAADKVPEETDVSRRDFLRSIATGIVSGGASTAPGEEEEEREVGTEGYDESYFVEEQPDA